MSAPRRKAKRRRHIVAIVRKMAEQVCVMQAGTIVEAGPAEHPRPLVVMLHGGTQTAAAIRAMGDKTAARQRMRAAGLNGADMLQRRGAYPPPPGHSPLPGLEIAGEVPETDPPSRCCRSAISRAIPRTTISAT